jgi:spore coat polysaccharide biosynthesis predicted glycosyltransferase SpsG
MDRSPIVFRCDATSQTGWESFYQCFSFASAYQRRRRPCYFMGTIEPFPLLSQIARGGNEYYTSGHPVGSPEDCNETIRMVRKSGAAAVIVAAPGVTTDYLRELESAGAVVGVLDSEATVRFPSRLVINPMLAPEKKHYEFERGTQLLLGSRHAIVRSVFRRQRQIRVAEPNGAFRAIIAMGDDDFAEQSVQRAREILNSSRIDKLSVMVRSHYPYLAELQELKELAAGRMEILTETSELSTRLPRAHFALTSGDGWSLEMACVGIPQLIISQNARHGANGKRIDEEGAANYLGESYAVTELQLRDAINNLLDDQLERVGMARCAKHLIDGRGLDRLVNGLEILLHPVQQPAVLRLVA